MKVIYSLYIDIPDNKLDDQPNYAWDNISKSKRTKIELANYYDQLIECKQQYAEETGCEFIMFERDKQYEDYENYVLSLNDKLTVYDAVNFYKLKLVDILIERGYTEILYLDFDVVPNTKESFFDVWDIHNYFCVKNMNDDAAEGNKVPIEHFITCNRNPSSKYWNAFALLETNGFSGENDVINTGIFGTSKEVWNRINYFGDFEDTIRQMVDLKEDDFYPQNYRNVFAFDNETVIAYKLKANNVECSWLDEDWHMFVGDTITKKDFLKEKASLYHFINKRFDWLL